MKKSLSPFCLFVFLFSCNNASNTETAKTDSTAKKQTLTYPFTPKYSVNWQPGDEKNAVMALTSLKKFVDGDVKGAFAYFADSIEFIGDKFHFIGKKDSLEIMFTAMRGELSSMSFEPDTWLASYHPDKGDSWVTVWGLQKWTDKKGKKDSVYLTDDMYIVNGKIAEIDEKQRAFAAPVGKK